jgi:chaperonin GroES
MTTATRPKIKIRIQPLEDRVVIRASDEVETRRGPLYIPDTAREKPTQGEILAAGPGRLDKTGKRLPMDVKVGDTVIYGKYTGTPYEVSGDELIIIKASDILAVIG